MATKNFLYKRELAINDKISVYIPTVGEILDDEDSYYDLVSMFVAMPIDMMVFLDDAGIDFTTIDEYQLFLLMFSGIAEQNTRLILGDLDLTKFRIATNEQNGMIVLVDAENDIVIDRAIYSQIAWALRKIHNLEKNNRKPGNEEAKKFMIKRERAKMKRRRGRLKDSQLESLIVAMVNAEQYKYDFLQTRDLSIYQFNECVRQVIRKDDYNNKMYGVYTGSINAKDLSPDDLVWWSSKNKN